MNDDELKHIGTPRHSGRYPWGSGKNPQQRDTTFLGKVEKFRKQGLSNLEIAKALDTTLDNLRKDSRIERTREWLDKAAFAARLRDKGMSPTAIGRRMGNINESSVRSLLNPALKRKYEILDNVANTIKENVKKHKYIDVGLASEQLLDLNVNETTFKTAIRILEREGYKVHFVDVPSFGSKYTSMKVLAAPGVKYKEVFDNKHNIKMINDHFEDNGAITVPSKPLKFMSSDRIKIRYAEEGGKDKDGVIEIRQGVPELDLGGARYSQVRIGVDGTHFMKGMAIRAIDIPDGIDIIYNTNKSKNVPKEKVFKELEKDNPDYPFGSVVRQKTYTDGNGKEQDSLIYSVGTLGKTNDEGAWANWHRSISSQVLSKQNPDLAKRQLEEAFNIKKDEFNEINSLTNPAIKKRLLDTFADETDSAAVHLKAAALPRQASQVLLPVVSMKEDEVFAPNFRPGERVVLIRHPHGGTFEIPELKVNNSNKEAIAVYGKQALDLVGINPKVAAKLSGADFDGDAVIVIPNDKKYIKIDTRETPSIKSLREFDPKRDYKDENLPKMTDKQKALQMGNASNLITDMTIGGANIDEIVRAVKHSMVVIDAQKHSLDYHRSAVDFNIPELKKKYQGGENRGAATVISKAKSDFRVLERLDRGTTTTKANTNPETGEKIYRYKTDLFKVDPKTGKRVRITVPTEAEAKALGGVKYINKQGKLVQVTTKSTKMAEADDAYKLSSGTRIESIYADHANKLKALANTARKTSLSVEPIIWSHSANLAYFKEIESLESKLRLAYYNKPFERKAHLIKNEEVRAKKVANPGLEPKDIKKIKGEELVKARLRLGVQKQPINITDREWEAIQAGAISNSKLSKILLNTNIDELRERALPRSQIGMSPDRTARARTMLANGHTRAEIADALGVGLTTLTKALE